MARRSFGPRTAPLQKRIRCSCGGESKLIQRRNFPHGKKADGITSKAFVCKSCGKSTSA